MAGKREMDQPKLQALLETFSYQYREHSSISNEQLEDLDGYKAILSYLSRKGGRRKNLRYYSSRKRIVGILNESSLYLTDGSGWNDSNDRGHFNPDFSKEKFFGICLSADTAESIAMWMLYGGIDGNGAMINFDKKTLFEAFEQSVKCDMGRFDEGEFKVLGSVDVRDVTLRLIDVLYYENRGDGAAIAWRNGDKQATVSLELLYGMGRIVKHAAWSYENEVRLVASIDKSLLKDGLSNATAMRLPLALSERFCNQRVFDSPIADEFGTFCDSSLKGTIEWDLCSGCSRRRPD